MSQVGFPVGGTTTNSQPVDVSLDAATTVSNDLPHAVYGTPDLATANGLVTAGWANAQALADSARKAAEDLVSKLDAIAAKLTGAMPGLSTTITGLSDLASDLDTFAASALTETVPALTFTGTEAREKDYDEPEFTRLRAALDRFVQFGGTGIELLTENALWARGKNRVHKAQAARAVEASQALSIIGMPKPFDALALDLAEAGQAVVSADATYDRDVGVKQAQLEQVTFHFTFEQSPELYQMLMSFARDRLQRGLQAARSVLEATTRGFGGTVEAFAANGEYHAAFLEAQVQVDKARVDARTAQANIRVEASQANIRLLIQQATTLAQTVHAAAELAAQLAAAALSSVNISASSHGANSWALSVHDGRSRSISASIGASTDNSYSYTP